MGYGKVYGLMDGEGSGCVTADCFVSALKVQFGCSGETAVALW